MDVSFCCPAQHCTCHSAHRKPHAVGLLPPAAATHEMCSSKTPSATACALYHSATHSTSQTASLERPASAQPQAPAPLPCALHGRPCWLSAGSKAVGLWLVLSDCGGNARQHMRRCARAWSAVRSLSCSPCPHPHLTEKLGLVLCAETGGWGLGCAQRAGAAAAAAAHRLPARVLDGRAVAAAWQEELAREVRDVYAKGGRPPGLGVVLVGSRPDSLLYVTRKREACERVRAEGGGCSRVQTQRASMPASLCCCVAVCSLCCCVAVCSLCCCVAVWL